MRRTFSLGAAVVLGCLAGQQAFAQDIDRDHTLVWGAAATPAGLDGGFYYSLEALEVEKNVYDSYLKYSTKVDPDSGLMVPDFDNIEGMLAEKWWVEDDGKTIFVKLREGVISHHGNELTADDVLYGYQRAERLKSTLYGFSLAGLGVTDVEKQIEKVDKYTFKYKLDTVNPLWEDWLTHTNNYVIDSTEFKKHETVDDPDAVEWSAKNTAGFGPYKVVKFTPGQEVVLEAHEEYWNKAEEPQYFKRIIEREIPSSANRLALLISGDIDAARDLTLNELKQLEGNSDTQVLRFAGNMLVRVDFNNKQPPFDNPLVRKALAFATPYEAVQESVYLGSAKQSKSINPSTYPTYTDEYWQYSLDYDKAKELLAEAGYPDGFATVIDIESGITEAEQIAVNLRDSFKNIGVDLQIQKLLSGDFYSKVNQGGFEGMWLFRDAAGIPDGGFGAYLWLTTTSAVNPGQYSNEEVDKLFAETQTTLDEDVRSANFKRIQEITVWEDPAWLFIAEPGFHIGARSDIEGLQWNTLSETRWGRVSRK